MKIIITIQVLLSLLVFGSWCGNLYKFLNCDFEPSFKAEIVHGVGLIPLVSIVTVWIDAGQ